MELVETLGLVAHHGEFKVAVTAVCQREKQKKTEGWGSGGKEGEGERREERAVRQERKKKGRGGRAGGEQTRKSKQMGDGKIKNDCT